MDKFTRLLNLVGLLQQSPTALTFAEIRERLRGEAYPQRDPESARRAFERDKADLLDMGVPLTVIPEQLDGSTTTYTIERRSRAVRDPGFSTEELGALHFAAAAMSLRGRDDATLTDARDGLRKLGGLGGESPERGVGELRLDENLTTAFTAIVEGGAIGFTHSDRTRMLRPRQIVARHGHWYLHGFDLHAREERTFRLDRIEGAVLPLPEEVLEEAGAGDPGRVASLRFRPWEFGTGEALDAEVRLDAPAAAVALATDPGLEVLEESGDHVVLGLEVRNRAALWQWLLTFLDRAELLAPPELVEQFCAHLEGMSSPEVTP